MAATARRHRKKLTALLDACADHQEGADHHGPTPQDSQAMRAYALLANGMGGIDWAGLGPVCEYLGVHDPESLMHRIEVIKQYLAADKQDTNKPAPTTNA